MESSMDLFERQMATNQRVIKFRRKKQKWEDLHHWLSVWTSHPRSFWIPQGVFNWTSVFSVVKRKTAFGRPDWLVHKILYLAGQFSVVEFFPFLKTWFVKLVNFWWLKKSRNAQKRKFAQRDAWDHWDCANPLHTHLTSSQHQSPPGFEAFQENKKVGKGEEMI